jgi:hypothetical protein
MSAAGSVTPRSIGEIAQRTHLIRGQRVVLDSDLIATVEDSVFAWLQRAGLAGAPVVLRP